MTPLSLTGKRACECPHYPPKHGSSLVRSVSECNSLVTGHLIPFLKTHGNQMHSYSSVGKLIIFKTVTSAQLSKKKKRTAKSTLVLKITLELLFAEGIKERIYNVPNIVATSHLKITIIAF